MARLKYGESGRGYGITKTYVPKKRAKKKKKIYSFRPRTKHFYMLNIINRNGLQMTSTDSFKKPFEIVVPLQGKMERIHIKSAGVIKLNKIYKIKNPSIDCLNHEVLISGEGYEKVKLKMDEYKQEYTISNSDFVFSVYRKDNDDLVDRKTINKKTKSKTKGHSIIKQRNDAKKAITHRDSNQRTYVVDTEIFNKIRSDNAYPLVVDYTDKDKKKR